ncbi:hypothetical protein [Streptomyces pinistramenti]|uniref:hypothetical protein n=1 Tax=Streptomyces pinistramenti TaxID=2884812 RepID=UPI001D069853|nr:hypothetical protein [Streptomyces pinistramenti]MCB5905884.1 hypothetical protein [Streptomyces pinistramenti]
MNTRAVSKPGPFSTEKPCGWPAARAAPSSPSPWPLSSLRSRIGQAARTPSTAAGEDVIRMPLPDWRTSKWCMPSVEWNAVPNHSVADWSASPPGRRGMCCL